MPCDRSTKARNLPLVISLALLGPASVSGKNVSRTGNSDVPAGPALDQRHRSAGGGVRTCIGSMWICCLSVTGEPDPIPGLEICEDAKHARQIAETLRRLMHDEDVMGMQLVER